MTRLLQVAPGHQRRQVTFIDLNENATRSLPPPRTVALGSRCRRPSSTACYGHVVLTVIDQPQFTGLTYSS